MSIWRTRLLVLLTAVAMLLAVSGSAAMADDFDDCEFVGFDNSGEALFLCESDFDDFDNFDNDFDNFDDCLGAEIGNECFGIDTFDFDDDFDDDDFDDDDFDDDDHDFDDVIFF